MSWLQRALLWNWATADETTQAAQHANLHLACLCRGWGAAQRRCGQYMQQIVTPTALPPWRDRCLKVSNVVVYAYDALKAVLAASELPERPASPGSASSQPLSSPGTGGSPRAVGRALLMIFQRGLVVWANRAIAEARGFVHKVCLLPLQCWA